MRSILSFLGFGKKKTNKKIRKHAQQRKGPSDEIIKSTKKEQIKQRKGSFDKIINSTRVSSRFSKTSKKPTIAEYYLSTIRLFKALEISTKRKKKQTKALLNSTIKNGFVFSPEVVANFSQRELIKLASVIQSEVGISPEEMNSSFHKSWKKIKEAKIETLVLEQITHYFTTYGFELFGVYDKDSVFIPAEQLDIPEIKVGPLKISIIKGYTKDELKDKLLKLLKSGIALKEDTVKDILNVFYFVDIKKEQLEEIKNREAKIVLCDYFGVVPEEPIEFLRYVTFKTTQKTLLIKDAVTIESIKKNADSKFLVNAFIKYHKKCGLERLSQIFLRYKPLFLAFRVDDDTKTIINRIRKYAVEHHKPLKEDYLNTVTAKIKNKVKINKKELVEELAKVNTFRKIRLAYALKFRARDVDSILYKIRNGKSFATNLKFKQKKEAKRIYDIIIDSIIQDISKNVKGKKIYIPKNINYTMPATEKQFTGAFPNGTYVSVPKDMIVGIHWKNVAGNRVDLDLSMVNMDRKIGWNGMYRNKERSILFSGDMTDAPGIGATELFYIKKQKKESYMLFLNYFNFKQARVPFKVVVAQEKASNFGRNYMVDPNNVVTVAKSSTQEKQKILGLLILTPSESRFYFGESYIGNSISAYNSPFANNARKYLYDFYTRAITFNEILEKAGARLVKKKDKCDIDLSPEALERDTIIKLIS